LNLPQIITLQMFISQSFIQAATSRYISELLLLIYINLPLFGSFNARTPFAVMLNSSSKHTDSTLTGQRDQALRVRSPLNVDRLDGSTQRLRPCLALLLVLADNHTAWPAGCKELSCVIPGESCDRSSGIQSSELVELAQVPDDGAGLVFMCRGEPGTILRERDSRNWSRRCCRECVGELRGLDVVKLDSTVNGSGGQEMAIRMECDSSEFCKID
jgi:hypothetical protein